MIARSVVRDVDPPASFAIDATPLGSSVIGGRDPGCARVARDPGLQAV